MGKLTEAVTSEGVINGEVDIVHCSSCNGDEVHPTRVTVNAGGKIYTIDKEGIHFDIGKPTSRGSTTELEFWCEGCRATFVVSMRFHKGRTLLWNDSISDTPEEAWGNTIWRN